MTNDATIQVMHTEFALKCMHEYTKITIDKKMADKDECTNKASFLMYLNLSN